MSKDVTFNIPISKVDDEQRMVWGYATTEALDSQSDIVDYEASKAAFSKWAGNIREMHRKDMAVGKTMDIQFDDDARKVMIGVYVSKSADGENAWTKIKEGVLTGFSIGGSVLRAVKDTVKVAGMQKSVNRILEYVLGEVSLVDVPACPEAQFVMVKSIDGNLQRVEQEEEPQKPFAAVWWVKSYMPTIEKAQKLYDANSMKDNASMKKGMWDASMLLDLAIELGYYINSEEYEGEDAEDLKAALDTIKNAIVQELTEPTETLTVAVELAQKVHDLRKGKTVAEDKTVEKTNVVGGVERDEKAQVVANETAKAPETVATATTKETPKAPETPAGQGAAEGEKPVTTEESEKSAEVTDLTKAVQSLLAKFDKQPESDLQKVNDSLAKVGDRIASLEERLSKVESAPMPNKAKASFVEVTKGGEEVTQEFADLQKRSEHLAVHPEDAQPGEVEQLTLKMRKFAKQG